jgi:AcrR family transcriptional regulator
MATASTSAARPAARRRYARGEGDRLRVDLMEAAADLMAVHGTVEGISLRAVARRTGVSPTAVYRHFDDHTELLAESVRYCWEHFRDVMQEASDSSSDPFEAFHASGQAYVRFAMENPGQYRVMFSNTIDVPLDHEDIDAASMAPAETVSGTDQVAMSAFQLLVELVQEMLAVRGDGRDPFFVAVQVHTWIHGMVDLCANHPDAPWPPIAELLAGIDVALDLTPPPTARTA